MTSTPAHSPSDRETADGTEPVSSGQPSDEPHVVDTVEVVETNQPLDEWGED